MKYIAKAKGANRFKTYESITEFDTTNFESYELYEVKQLNKEQYGEALRQQKINELKSQLSELGVDLNAIVPPAPTPQVQVSEPTSESPLLAGDKVTNGKPAASKIKKKDGTFMLMDEVADAFYKATPMMEKDIPDIMFSQFDENGITLMMTEIRPDLPKVLPNGIPVKQVLG